MKKLYALVMLPSLMCAMEPKVFDPIARDEATERILLARQETDLLLFLTGQTMAASPNSPTSNAGSCGNTPRNLTVNADAACTVEPSLTRELIMENAETTQSSLNELMGDADKKKRVSQMSVATNDSNSSMIIHDEDGFGFGGSLSPRTALVLETQALVSRIAAAAPTFEARHATAFEKENERVAAIIQNIVKKNEVNRELAQPMLDPTEGLQEIVIGSVERAALLLASRNDFSVAQSTRLSNALENLQNLIAPTANDDKKRN